MGRILDRDGSTGHDWCSRRNRKKAQKGKGQTAGSQKGQHCQATPLERYIAKRNRSYKHEAYDRWCETHKGRK